jgi:hypothetical protein
LSPADMGGRVIGAKRAIIAGLSRAILLDEP